ncbi:MAG TPA: acyl-CoA thioesterase [Cytophagales bacterium]|nr:acyl-CoA thioesterase [Cytophagales bacterium]
MDQERVDRSMTTHVVPVFPFRMNHHQTLFGGVALQWMDEVAFVSATRYSRKRLVTMGSEKVEFLKPIQMGDFAEVTGKVVRVGTKSITVEVLMHMEKMYEDQKELAAKGYFTFVAVDEEGKSIAI